LRKEHSQPDRIRRITGGRFVPIQNRRDVMMNNARFEDALTDVAKVFADPKEIAGSAELSHQQKVKLLRQWEFDLRENMVASEENMTAENLPEGHSAELLRGVRKALIEIGAVDHKDESAAPMKQGGA
jgi:hypothetical protein